MTVIFNGKEMSDQRYEQIYSVVARVKRLLEIEKDRTITGKIIKDVCGHVNLIPHSENLNHIRNLLKLEKNIKANPLKKVIHYSWTEI